MSTTTVTTTTKGADQAPQCTTHHCVSAFDLLPTYLCDEAGRHRGRVWHYDTSVLAFEVTAVAYIEHRNEVALPTKPTDWQVLFRVEDDEGADSYVEQTMTLTELDGLIDALQVARRDICRTVTR